MKRIFLALMIALCSIASLSATPIVNNVGTSSEDTLTVRVLSLDSMGYNATADSFYLYVMKSGANDVVFRDSCAATSVTWLDTMAVSYGPLYYLRIAVANIDGAGDPGVYSGLIIAVDTDTGFVTENTFSFQIVDNALSVELATVNTNLNATVSSRSSHAATAIVSSGAITTSGGAVSTVTTTTTATNVTTVNGLASNVITAASIAASAMDGKGNWNIGKTDYALSAAGVDAIWDEAQAGHVTAGTFGLFLDAAVTSAGGGSLDSAIISRIVGRKVWGIPAGSGSDSTARALRIVDSTTTVRAIMNTPFANHVIANTFGDNIDAEISAIGGAQSNGAGAFVISVQVTDTGAAPDSVVTGIVVTVNNEAQSATPLWSVTGNTGIAAFNLNAGTWVIFTSHPGFAQHVDTVVIAGVSTQNLDLYRDGTGRTAIAMQFDKPNASPWDSAVYKFELVMVNDSMPMVADTVLGKKGRVSFEATATQDGLMSLNIWANETITIDSSYYRVSVYDKRGRRKQLEFNVWIPKEDTTQHLNHLTRWDMN